MNKMFIKICSIFIAQVKEDKNRLFWGSEGVQTDDYSAPSTADNVNRQYS